MRNNYSRVYSPYSNTRGNPMREAPSSAKSYRDLPFSELGKECSVITSSMDLSDADPITRAIKFRKATAGSVGSFIDHNFGNRGNDYSIRILDSILFTLRSLTLSTVDGNDYEPSRATEDLKKLDSEKMTPLEYFQERAKLPSLIDGVSFVKNMFSLGSEWRGIYELLVHDSRSYLARQYSRPASSYCSLVPLLMQPFKLNKYSSPSNTAGVHVPYMHWSPSTIQAVTHPALLTAMVDVGDPKPSQEEIIAARTLGLTVQSGKTAGQVRNAATYYGFHGTDHALASRALFSRMMLGQTWAAHPNNRSAMMVLDPYNWDLLPEPLLSTEVFTTPSTSRISSATLGIRNCPDLPF